MEMHRQVLGCRPGDDPIVIDTPVGLIIMNRLVDDSRKFEIFMPKGVTAWIGKERAFKESKFLERKPDGRIVPKFNILTPIQDDKGELVGIESPKAFVLGQENDNGTE